MARARGLKLGFGYRFVLGIRESRDREKTLKVRREGIVMVGASCTVGKCSPARSGIGKRTEHGGVRLM